MSVTFDVVERGTSALAEWFEWASSYARAAGLEPGPCPYCIDREKGALLDRGEVLWENQQIESLLPVAEWHSFFDWAQELKDQYLVCHAAVLEREGQAILLVAKSGTGKSSLALNLVRRGFGYLGDEFALLCLETLEVLPFPKALCIKDPTTVALGSFNPHFDVISYPPNFARRYKDLICCLPRKEIVPPPGVRFPVCSIVLLQGEPSSGPPVRVPRWQGTVALYRSCWWREGVASFRDAAALAREVEFWAVGRSSLDEMADWIESAMRISFAGIQSRRQPIEDSGHMRRW